MYPIKTIVTDTELIVGRKSFKYGEILTTLLNENFDKIVSFEDFLLSIVREDSTNINVDKASTTFLLIDSIILKLDFYKDNISNKNTLSNIVSNFEDTLEHNEYVRFVQDFAVKYLQLIEDLQEIDGFYRKYIEEYYHDCKHYPKSLDIAKSFNKYREDFPDIDETQSKYITPNRITTSSSPIITEDGRVYEVHYHEILSSLVYLDFMECIKREIMPKKCKNCNKFYLPSFGYYSEFCNEIAPNEKTRTCREVGSKASFDKKLNENPILKEYQKSYKTHHARFVKKKMTKDELEQWKIFAKDMMEQVTADKITFEEYLTEIKR